VDSWRWKLEDEGTFTVSSSYELLVELVLPLELLSETKEMVFGAVWKSLAPSIVVVFSWQLLLDRIPTKDNLLRRRILPSEASVRCVLRPSGRNGRTSFPSLQSDFQGLGNGVWVVRDQFYYTSIFVSTL